MSALLSVICPPVGLCDLLPGIGGALSQAGGGLASSVVGDVLGGLGAGIQHAATQVVATALSALVPSSDPSLSGAALTGAMVAMREVGLFLALPMLFVATIGAVARQDTGRLARVWLVLLPLSVAGTFALLPLVGVAMQATGAMTDLLTAVPGGPGHLAPALAALVTTLSTSGNGALGVISAALILVGAVVLDLELVVRNAAIELTVCFLPLLLAAALWPSTLGALRRALEVLVALILARFVITATLLLGAQLVVSGDGTGSELTGVAILLLAAFAPFAVLRLVPLVEGAAIGHLEGRSRQPFRAAAGASRLARQVPAAAAAFGLLGAADGAAAGASQVAGGGGRAGRPAPGDLGGAVDGGSGAAATAGGAAAAATGGGGGAPAGAPPPVRMHEGEPDPGFAVRLFGSEGDGPRPDSRSGV